MSARGPEGLPVVVVVGEALVDVETSSAGAESHPGGSPMNVAFGLARLGLPTTLHTRIGRDAHGTAISAHLSEAGVRLPPTSIVDAPTSTATAVLDAAGRAEYTFDVAWELPSLSIPDSSALVHTGSIAAVLEPGADEVLRLVRARHEHEP